MDNDLTENTLRTIQKFSYQKSKKERARNHSHGTGQNALTNKCRLIYLALFTTSFLTLALNVLVNQVPKVSVTYLGEDSQYLDITLTSCLLLGLIGFLRGFINFFQQSKQRTLKNNKKVYFFDSSVLLTSVSSDNYWTYISCILYLAFVLSIESIIQISIILNIRENNSYAFFIKYGIFIISAIIITIACFLANIHILFEINAILKQQRVSTQSFSKKELLFKIASFDF